MNIRLRDVEPGDLPQFFADQQDPEAVAMAAFKSRDRPAFDQHWAKILADDTGRKQTILCDGAVAGYVTSWDSDGKREIGYWISRAYWGRGVATAGLAAFLRLEQTRPLFAGVAKHNSASLRVLRKCGFMFLPSDDASREDQDTHDLLVLAAED